MYENELRIMRGRLGLNENASLEEVSEALEKSLETRLAELEKIRNSNTPDRASLLEQAEASVRDARADIESLKKMRDEIEKAKEEKEETELYRAPAGDGEIATKRYLRLFSEQKHLDLTDEEIDKFYREEKITKDGKTYVMEKESDAYGYDDGGMDEFVIKMSKEKEKKKEEVEYELGDSLYEAPYEYIAMPRYIRLFSDKEKLDFTDDEIRQFIKDNKITKDGKTYVIEREHSAEGYDDGPTDMFSIKEQRVKERQEKKSEEEEKSEEEKSEEEKPGVARPQLKNPNLPQISFFEVVAKTDTVHIGNLEGKMHTLAHQPLFSTGIIKSLKAGDPVGALTGFVPKTIGSIVMFGPKVFSKIACAVRGTNKKVKELRENIEGLSQEEFEILTQDNGHMDYSLNPVTMTAFKFNDKYLEAIKERVDKERSVNKQRQQEQINILNKEKKAIEEAMKKGSYTKEEMSVLVAEATNRAREIDALANQMQREESNRLAFEDGMDLKSSRKKNIEGWIAATHNPNNINSHIKMAHFSKEIREARENGDYARELQLVNDRDKYIEDQTHTVMGHISRGNYQKAQVTVSREQQTKGREVLTTAAVVTSILATVRAVEIDRAKAVEQERLNQQISTHNQNIKSHNQQLSSQSAQQQLHQQLQGNGIDDQTINGAVRYQQYSDAANVRMQREGIYLNNGGAKTGSWSKVNEFDSNIQAYDAATHAQEGTLVGGIRQGAGTQLYIDTINKSVDNMTNTLGEANIAEAGYQAASGHAQFAVSRFMDATTQAQVYSGAFKQFFADALHQNDVIQQILQQTPITTAAAQQMGTFTINIPSAIIPVASALVANAINAYESSNKAAKKVAKEFSDKQQKERNHKENAEKEISKNKQDNSNKENVR